MAVIKCKMCGGDVDLSPDKTFGTCEYCGSVMTFPKVDDEQRAAAFNRGNHFRRIGEFDKALAVYERIVQENEDDAEAHWCCALCRFGIEYVEDPSSYEWLPTCHRASFDSFLEDVDYLATVKYSDGITRRQYQKDAARIAEVQRGILATSQNEAPFDVFICYKETDDSGNRTVDSTLAQDIYYQLTEQGRRVFFSRITLEDKAGAEYEPYIFAALNSARVMVAVGTRPEHFNAVWVKNEWSRYLALMKKDRSKLLVPCYRDMDPYDLPEQLSVLQSYDMGKIGFIQDLVRGINKVLAADKKPEPVKETVVVQGEGSSNLTALLKRGNMALEDGEWVRADEFFDRVLDMDAECAEAYWGKALAKEQCPTAQMFVKKRLAAPDLKGTSLKACDAEQARIDAAVEKYAVIAFLSQDAVAKMFASSKLDYTSYAADWEIAIRKEKEYWTQNKRLSRAVRYAKGDFATTLTDVQAQILRSLEQKLKQAREDDKASSQKIQEEYKEFLDQVEREVAQRSQAASEKLAAKYQACCAAMEVAQNEWAYRDCAAGFCMILGYQDSKRRMAQCEDIASSIEAEEQKRQKKISQLKSEQSDLYLELAQLKGLFSGKQRREIEVQLAEIEKELDVL